MAKRIYSQTIIKWLLGLGLTGGTLIGSIFYYLALTGAITVNGFSGDSVCGATDWNQADICYAYINFTANEDIFLYQTGYDPWGRNETFSFEPNIKDWKLQRSWGSGWRNIPLDKSCTGTWCGLSNKDDTRKFSIAFRKGRSYEIRLAAIKYDGWEDIKWGAFDGLVDPVWIGDDKKNPKYKEVCKPNSRDVTVDGVTHNLVIGGQRYANSMCDKLEVFKSLKNVEFSDSYKPIISKNDPNYRVDEIRDWNSTSLTLCVGTHAGLSNKDISLKSYNKYNESDVKMSVVVNLKTAFDSQCYTLPLGFDKEVKWGENSTTVQLVGNNNTADLWFDDYSAYSSQIKWDISSIPSDITIDDATLSIYVADSGSGDDDFRFWRITDQTWTEATSVATLDSLTKTNVTTTTYSNSDYTWSYINITIVVKTDYDLSNTYSSIRFEDPDYLIGTIEEKYDDAYLGIGDGGGSYSAYFNDREDTEGDSSTPYLNITYTSAVSDSCTWSSPSHTYECSDSCNITSVDVGGETVYINGSGTFRWVRNITNASTIHIQNGCRAIS